MPKTDFLKGWMIELCSAWQRDPNDDGTVCLHGLRVVDTEHRGVAHDERLVAEYSNRHAELVEKYVDKAAHSFMEGLQEGMAGSLASQLMDGGISLTEEIHHDDGSVEIRRIDTA